jgi:hypothetical protein
LANLTTILAKVRQNVIDLPGDTEDRLESWVNEAQVVAEAYHLWLGTWSTWFAETDGTSLLVDSVTDLKEKPADWLHADGDPYWRNGFSGANHFVEWAPSLQDVRRDYSSHADATGSPKTLREEQDRVWVYPTPDENNPIGVWSSAGEYNLVIPYRARAEVLTAAGTITNFFTTDADQALHLEDYASAQAMLFNRDIQNAQLYLAKAAAHLLRAKRLDKLRKSQSIKITPRRDVHASRKQRRAV